MRLRTFLSIDRPAHGRSQASRAGVALLLLAVTLALPSSGVAQIYVPPERTEAPKEAPETPKEATEAPKEATEAPKEATEAPKEPFSLDKTEYRFSWDTPAAPAPPDTPARSEFCTGLDTLMASSPGRFLTQRGDKTRTEAGVTVYKSPFKLAGLSACVVLAYDDENAGSAWISCGRKLPTDVTAEAAKEAYSKAVQEVTGCLDPAQWKPTLETWEAGFERNEPSAPKLEVTYKQATRVLEIKVVSINAKPLAGEAFCQALGQVANAAGDNFKELRVQQDVREFYASSVSLPGAGRCSIEASKGKPARFACDGTETDDHRLALEVFKRSVEAVGSCLPPDQWKARVYKFGTATFTHAAPNAPKIEVIQHDRMFAGKELRDKLGMKQYHIAIYIGLEGHETKGE